jgi:dTDP-glucose 4,6-dehydratase
MKKLFGAAFIGSAFIRIALAQIPSCEITNFDVLTYAGKPDNLEGLDEERYRLVRSDVAEREAVFAALGNDTDAIINFTSESHVDRSIASARERRASRFFQVLTDEVIGSPPENETAFFTGNSPFAPNSSSAASKTVAEHRYLVHGKLRGC